MSQGLPSMTALLGLLAVAGYQNRDKIGEMLGGMGGGAAAPAGAGRAPTSSSGSGGIGGLLSSFGGAAGGAGAGSLLSGGIGELVDRFKKAGHGDVAESWIGHGTNREVAPPQIEKAIGSDVLAALAAQTGLSKDELLARLSRELPTAVDKYTPHGRMPTDADYR